MIALPVWTTQRLPRGAPASQAQTGPWLQFRDPNLETAYLAREYHEHRRAIIINVVVAMALMACFVLLDSLLLPAEAITSFRVARFAVQVPLLLTAVVVLMTAQSTQLQIACTALMMTICQLCWPILLVIGGEPTLGYLSLALMQTLIGTYFMVGLPVRWSIPIACGVCLLFLGAAAFLQLTFAPATMYGVGCATIAIIGAFGAYRAEDATRRQFVATLRSEAEYSERLAAQAELTRWLATVADFLRHELKGAMVGVSTSLDLACRKNTDVHVSEYLERGQRSVGYMQRLLTQVANATSLEAALKLQDLEPVSLSELLRAYLEDFRRDHDDWRVEERIETGLKVQGNVDSLVQMLDKLFDNALAHGDRRHALCITLRAGDGHALLAIADRGDALPGDIDSIFAPFVSTKRDRSQSLHLGLGLYVVRMIAIEHRGDVIAEHLQDPPGAIFTVSLPLLPS
jgi:signal transduction histidine kinase